MMRIISAFFAAFLVLAVPAAAAADSSPAANPKDVDSINSIIAATYASISGPKGHERDWNRFRSLFIPDARLIAVVRRNGKTPVVRSITVARYIQLDEPIMLQKGFFEVETGRDTRVFHGIVSVLSSYAGRFDGGPVFDRGVNNFQLFFDGTRWYIVSIYWDTTDAEHPIPRFARPSTSSG
jgi:hypothetical protein